MLSRSHGNILIASPDPELLKRLEALLSAYNFPVDVAMTAQAALSHLATAGRRTLMLLDANLPGMPIDQFLAASNGGDCTQAFPIVLISDSMRKEWFDRFTAGVIADVVPAEAPDAFLRLRIDATLQSQRMARELERERELAVMNAQFDRLTGVYNRETMLSMLFRETDRVQRMNGSLCMVLFDIDDFGHWNERLGAEVCDRLLVDAVGRTARLLRSYDLLGRVGKDEFLIAMPGCSSANAVILVERLRAEVFGEPYETAAGRMRLSACFGISSSRGRSPLVVLREAEQALAWSRHSGPESIQCFSDCGDPAAPPVTFYSPVRGDKLTAW